MKYAGVLLSLAWFSPLVFSQAAPKPPALTGKEWRDAVLAGLEEADKWKPFTSAEADFRVRLPGAPKRAVQSNAEHESITYTLQDGKKFYWVARQSYKTDVAKTQTPDQLLDRGCNGILNGLQGKLLGKEAVTLDKKYPGREMRFTRGDATFRIRAYWVAPVMYLIAVRGDQEFISGTDAAVYLNSFEVLGKQGATPAGGGVKVP